MIYLLVLVLALVIALSRAAVTPALDDRESSKQDPFAG